MKRINSKIDSQNAHAFAQGGVSQWQNAAVYFIFQDKIVNFSLVKKGFLLFVKFFVQIEMHEIK